MARRKTTHGLRRICALLLFMCAAGANGTASAQEGFLESDAMSLLEAPLATEVGDVTLLVRGMAEGGWTYRRESDDSDESFGARFQAGARTQLQNRWRVRLRYSGRYATDPQENPDAGFASRADEEYEDDVTLTVGGEAVWASALLLPRAGTRVNRVDSRVSQRVSPRGRPAADRS